MTTLNMFFSQLNKNFNMIIKFLQATKDSLQIKCYIF